MCEQQRDRGEIYIKGIAEGATWPCENEKEHEIKEERSKGVSMY